MKKPVTNSPPNSNATDIALIVFGLVGVFTVPFIFDNSIVLVSASAFLIPILIGVILRIKKQGNILRKDQAFSLIVILILLVVYLIYKN